MFYKIIIHPEIIPGLIWAKASYHSINGLIESRWEKEYGKFQSHVVIPANTSSRIYIPAKDVESVTENGKSIRNIDGLKFLRKEGNYVVLKVGSGTYDFVSTSFKAKNR